MTAIESRQDVLDGKISLVLAIVDANTETLSELKSILAKFMGNPKVLDNGTLSESKSIVDHRSGGPLHIVDRQAMKTSSTPITGTLINHTNHMSLDNDERSKDGPQTVDVPTGNTCKLPTRSEKSPTQDKEVTIAVETFRVVYRDFVTVT
jgi:hypothetical protein